MARTDDDSWDITEGVGATALGVAWARSQEASSECALFTDTYAQRFIDAAIGPRMAAAAGTHGRTHSGDRELRGITNEVVRRLLRRRERPRHRAGGHPRRRTGRQGMAAAVGRTTAWSTRSISRRCSRSRPRRWPTTSPLLATSRCPSTFARTGRKPCATRVSIPQKPTAWAAEGLLPYLPAEGQDLLFERIHELSAPGSRVGVESFGAGFFDPEYLASRREQLRQMREKQRAIDDTDAPDVADLWFIEDRTDVADWLMEHGWRVSSEDAGDADGALRPPAHRTTEPPPRAPPSSRALRG